MTSDEMSSGNFSGRIPLEPGTHVSFYQIEAKLGEGGMGSVFKAVDTKLNRSVAIKFLSDDLADAVARCRFQREAQMASSLNHPHILTVHDIGEFDNRQYLVTEYVDGGTLEDWAKTKNRHWRQIVELLVGVADGLAVAHEAGILHRDIKPANVLVSSNGYAKLADFGLAKLAEHPNAEVEKTLTQSRTQPGTIIGTISYMSPEQASGQKLDSRSDIFSFGVVLYELLVGRRPFRGNSNIDILHAIIHDKPAPLPNVPAELRMVVEKAMEKDSADRYQSMREMVVDLRHLTRQTPAVAVLTYTAWKWAAAIVLIAAAITLGLLFWIRPVHAGIRSIAVLPLRNLSGGPDQEIFSDGTTEALISSLSKIHALAVTSRTSVMRYKTTTKSLRDIGKELGVDALIAGSVQRSGSRVRITAQLVQASTDANLWANEYERDLADELKLEAEIARTIAEEIEIKVTPEEVKRLRAKSVIPAAREKYLLGRSYFNRENAPDRRKAIELFEQAVQLQKDYAEPYAMLSLTWHLLEAVGAARPYEARSAARNAALSALELDPDLAEAHVAMAGVKWFEDWDWAGAHEEYRRGRELNPDSMTICACYTLLNYMTGRMSEAVEVGALAEKLDPLSALGYSTHGRALYASRRYEEAVPLFKKSLEINAQARPASVHLAKSYVQMGKLQDALAALDKPDFRPSPELAWVLALLGRRAEAVKMLESLTPVGADPTGISLVYFALGDKEAGFPWLTRAFDERQVFVNFVKYDPAFDGVRANGRFKELVARLRLPD